MPFHSAFMSNIKTIVNSLYRFKSLYSLKAEGFTQMVSYVDILYMEEIYHISPFKTLRFLQHTPPLFLAHASGFVALSTTPRPYTEQLLKSKFEYSLYLKM